jgi:hypothetical protein
MNFLIGIIIIIATVISFIISITRTPENLRGFYGLWYFIISVIAIIAAVLLILI